MKYLVLSKRHDTDEDPFMEPVSAGGDHEPQLPFTGRSQELRDHEAADLRRNPEIADVVPSMPFTLIEPTGEAADSAAAQTLWGLEAIGATTSHRDGHGVKVAILDTGIDSSHPAFAGLRLEDNLMDFTVNEKGVAGSAPDTHGHGTHVAGTLFGRPVDGRRIGVAPGVTDVLIGKVLGPQGGTTEALFEAIDWALRERADVISMSLSLNFKRAVDRYMQQEGYPQDIATFRALDDYRTNIRLFDRLAALVATRVAQGRGALLVAASGNQSRRHEDPRLTVPVANPGAGDGFISVGAVSSGQKRDAPFAVARFSNTGCVLAAPGVAILSAKLGGGLKPDSGTSMATPHVAGVIALWTQERFPEGKRPKGWAKVVQQAVERHVSPTPGQTWQDVGMGVVRAPQREKDPG
ncbi:S8 family serine peptidase [uncultured Bradyrhizobium sp.]|uniref:S8 family serine peptidase n=1 Tax=uncultured Bradyrhizobium sp. TaxID=199684 RepID=UPI0035CA02C8